MTRAAEAFVETLHELGLDAAVLETRGSADAPRFSPPPSPSGSASSLRWQRRARPDSSSTSRSPGLSRVVSELGGVVETPYTIATWLVTPEPDLHGKAPIQLLCDGCVDSVVTAAARYADRLRQ
jgi:hypothetical protein